MQFQKIIWDYYRASGRKFPWRNTKNPYRILVSEIMLQQTQTERVREKYAEFLRVFPTFTALASAPFVEVLRVWKGLGYNRRALYLQRIANIVVEKFRGRFPSDAATLATFPGIGPGTAGSLQAFIWNKPVVFIETNIRRVFLHFFFSDQSNISDKLLFPLIAKSLDAKKAREWYYAVMDYGAMLGKTAVQNPNKRSSHYTKQKAFIGSDRQLRGEILKELLENSPLSLVRLACLTGEPVVRVKKITKALEQEKLVQKHKNGLKIAIFSAGDKES